MGLEPVPSKTETVFFFTLMRIKPEFSLLRNGMVQC